MTARRYRWPLALLAFTVLATAATSVRKTRAPQGPRVIMYKGAQCECCLRWGKWLTDAGFTLEVRIPDDLAAAFAEHAIPPALRSCHVALVDGYAVVGHVPIAEIKRMLRERPEIVGIAVPGMPAGSPGMELPGTEPSHYEVLAFDRDGRTTVYARY